MKIHYGTVRIKVNAEEDEINGPGELALSDRFSLFQNKVEDAVINISEEYPEFEFEVFGE